MLASMNPAQKARKIRVMQSQVFISVISGESAPP